MEQPNKLMTRAEMKKAYPGKWIVAEKTKGNVSNVDEGIVKYVASDDEISDIWCECLDKGFNYDKFRTTTEPFMRVVDSVNFEITAAVI